MEFTRADVAPMSLGAAVLGAGGGGEPYVAEIMLAALLDRVGSVPVLSIDDLGDLDRVAPFAMVGSPHAISEMLVGLPMLEALLANPLAVQDPPTAVMPFEMAGVNALMPLAAAALLGLPCVDADFAGRGVPSLDLTVLQHSDAPAQEHVLIDALGRSVVVSAAPGLSAEGLLRPITELMGSLAAYSTRPFEAKDLAAQSLPGTLSRCLEIGRAFSCLAESEDDAADAVLRSLGACRIAEGSVMERLSDVDGFGQRASVVLESAEDLGVLTRIELRNEFHVVTRDGLVLATVPDLIVMLDRDTWTPLSVDDVVPGRDVRVVALAAHARWRTEEGIRIAGPRAFGHGVDYVPFETVRVSA